MTSDLLKAHGRFACTLAGEGKDADEDETAGGPYAQLVTGAMSLAEAAWGGNGCEALDSSQGRRLLGEVLGGTIKQAMALAEEADEAEKAGSDADEEEEEDEDSEEEEEEDEEGEEEGDVEDMAEGEDGESDNEESDMEEEDDDEFQARYADAAKALLEDNDDDVVGQLTRGSYLPQHISNDTCTHSHLCPPATNNRSHRLATGSCYLRTPRKRPLAPRQPPSLAGSLPTRYTKFNHHTRSPSQRAALVTT